MKIKVKSDSLPFVNIRSKPDIESSEIIGKAYPDFELEVDQVVNEWAFLPITISNIKIGGFAYVKAEYLDINAPTPIPSEPVKLPAKVRLGLHVMSNVGQAITEAGNGCKFFMVMDNNLGAHQLKTAFPDTVVMVRRYLRNRLTADDMVRALEVYPESRLVYTGHNEQDVIGSSVDAIRERAQFDAEVATKIKMIAPNARYAAGTWSMGEPNITDAGIVQALKDNYAPHFNSGLFDLDQHSYSTTFGLTDGEAEWLVRRWEFYFTKCGFNPARGQSIYMSETGADDGHQNGFRGQGASGDQFENWCRRFYEVNQRALVVNGIAYPSPVVGGAIFQLGGNGDPQWQRFEVSGLLPQLRKYYNFGNVVPVPTPNPVPPKPIPVGIVIPPLNQRDPKWSGKMLGFSNSTTLGGYGCLITCFAMLGDKRVDEMNELYKSHNLFVQDNLAATFDVNLAGIKGVSKPEYLGKFTDAVSDSVMAQLRSHLRTPDGFAIFEVDISASPSLQQHFVLGVGVRDGNIVINDPWWGDKALLAPRYGSTDAIAIYRIWLYTKS